MEGAEVDVFLLAEVVRKVVALHRRVFVSLVSLGSHWVHSLHSLAEVVRKVLPAELLEESALAVLSVEVYAHTDRMSRSLVTWL
jgi:hypothetical protein